MTSEQLKNSILQFAVQGKLVPQNPQDEPASEIFKKLKAEKEKLIKEKVIKKEKAFLPITEEEKPFEIPDSWEWVRIGDVSDIVNGGTPDTNKKEFWEGNILWVTPKDLGKLNSNFVDDTERKITNAGLKNSSAKILTENSVILSSRAPIGHLAINTKPISTNQGCKGITPYDGLNTKYLYYFLKKSVKLLNDLGSGTTFKELSGLKLSEVLIPLPPVAEQQLIVDKIEELLPLVEQYGTAESELRKLNNKFPEQLRRSVLQYAVQGKLITQILNEEPASKLLEKIKAEKKQLIKEKKIKQDKPLSEIKEDEIPFEIPDSWVWCRLGDVVNQIADIDHKMPEKTSSGIPFISPRDFYGINEINFESAHKISIVDYQRLSKKIKPQKGDIIFPRYGTIGVCRYIDFEKEFLVSYSCVTINTNKNYTYPKYIYYYCMSPIAKIEIEKYIVKTTQPNVGIASIAQFLIPLPPLSEQKLIVEKVEEVLSYCEQLK